MEGNSLLSLLLLPPSSSEMLKLICLLLAIVPLASRASLHFQQGLDGTELNLGMGLSDKQLAIFAWLESLVSDSKADGDFPGIYKKNNTGNLPTQRGMPSYRYSLAFTAYAAAARTHTHTPAHTGPTFNLLSTIFELMTREEVWSYWDQKGDCAPFFLTTYCENHNTSMCDLNAAWRGGDAIRCPDPVYYGNIMYSGHLAHVGALVRLFAPSPEAAEDVLTFTLGSAQYTLDRLLYRLETQALSQAETFGGGITCEPGNVYPSCQSHLQAALHLIDALDSTSDEKHTSIRQNWQHYLFNENLQKGWDMPAGSMPWGERLFEIAQMTPRHSGIPDFGIPVSCAAHDVWVLAYLQSWAEDDISGLPTSNYVLKRGRDLIRDHKGWSGGQLQDERCKVLAGEEDWDIASAMFSVVEAVVGDGDGEERSKEVLQRFEQQGKVAVKGKMFYYSSDYGLDVFTTTQLGMSMVTTNLTMASLHNEAGVALLERREGRGWLEKVEAIEGDENVYVRKAKSDDNELVFSLVAGGERDRVRAYIGGLSGPEEDVRVSVGGEIIEEVSFDDDGYLIFDGTVQDGIDSVFVVRWM